MEISKQQLIKALTKILGEPDCFNNIVVSENNLPDTITIPDEGEPQEVSRSGNMVRMSNGKTYLEHGKIEPLSEEPEEMFETEDAWAIVSWDGVNTINDGTGRKWIYKSKELAKEKAGFEGTKVEKVKILRTKEPISDCCGAPIRGEGGRGDFHDNDRPVTMHCVCIECGEPCNFAEPKDQPIEPKVMDWMNTRELIKWLNDNCAFRDDFIQWVVEEKYKKSKQ